MSYVVKRSPYCIITDDGEDDYTEENLAHSSVEVIRSDDTLKHSTPNNGRIIEYFPQTVNTDDNGALVYFGTGGTKFFDGVNSSECLEEVYYGYAEILKASTLPELKNIIIKGFNNSIKDRTHKINDQSASKLAVSFWEKYNRKKGKGKVVRHALFTEVFDEDEYLAHHGILGMKWGVRRYQNPDGSLTDAGRKHYGRNYTIHELKKNVQNAKTYEEKKAAVTANKVNRITKTPYRRAATTVATAGAGLASSGAMAGLMATGLISVNPLLPVAALAGGIAAGKTINAGRDVVNMFRNLRAEQIDRKIDKQHFEESNKKNTAKDTIVMVPAGTLPESTRLTGKEESDAWKAIAKQYESQAKASGSSNSSNKQKEWNTNNYEQRRSSYLSENKSRLLKDAKEKGTFDREFLESNGDIDDYGEPLEGKKLMNAYEKYLNEEIKKGR
jgi:hypothetical protein